MLMMFIIMGVFVSFAINNNIHVEGAIQDFYNFLSAPQTVSNLSAEVAWAQLCANHVQHIKRLSRATCSVPVGMKGQLSY